MGSLSLIDYDQPWLLPPYQLPSPSLHLTLDEDRPLLVLHPSLPLPTMTPLSSPTPLTTPPPAHSKSNVERSERRKARRDLYGPTKKGPRCKPSSPITRAKRETMSLFWKLEREIGLQEALECFQRVVDSGREEMEHDVMGCRCQGHSTLSSQCVLRAPG